MIADESVFIADGTKVLGEDVKIGAGCSIWYNAVVRCDDGEHVHIGDKTKIQDLSMVHTSKM